MFNSKIYVYFDKKAEKLVDSFIAYNKEVAIRFATMRINEAIRAKNFGLLSFWSDCLIYEIDLSKEKIDKLLIMDLDKFVPNSQELDKNEKN